jgi:hypothetical protein
MTGHLRLLPHPLESPPPELIEYRGRPVSWGPWEVGVVTSMRFHHDMSCEECGVNDDPSPRAIGSVEYDQAEMRIGRSYRSGDTCAVRELYASLCTGCGRIVVVSFEENDWWWTWGGPGALAVGVEHREPVEPAPAPKPVPAPRTPRRPPPRSATAIAPTPAPASADARAAARAAFAAAQAERKRR